jgi:hypothetical protein
MIGPPPAWGLGEKLEDSELKNQHFTKYCIDVRLGQILLNELI